METNIKLEANANIVCLYSKNWTDCIISNESNESGFS